MEARVKKSRKLPTQFKRRVAAILFADAADFCRLMGANDELTLSRLLAYRQIHEEIVSSEGGRMFGVAGDSWMAEFTGPVEAVRCAAECQRALEGHNAKLPEEERIRFRIGIHMGGVIASNGNLFGDSVNIAARLGELCRPGHLVVSDDVFRRVFDKAAALRFSSLGPQRLKNISNDITAFSAQVTQAAGGPALLPEGSGVPVPAFRDKPAIAVLPFQTLGGESGCLPFQEKFGEALVSGLSNLRWLSVISRRASFMAKDGAINTATIGRTLGAYYLVTGSVLRMAGDFRFTVNLLDAGNGMDLWSQSYRIGAAGFSGALQDIATSVVCILDFELERAEQMRLGPREIEDSSSWDLVRHGMLLARRYIGEIADFTKGDAALAGRYFEEAVRRDPGSSEARIQLARWHMWAVWQKQCDPIRMQMIEKLTREAILIDQLDARAYHLLGFARMTAGKLKEARAYYHDAIALNPSLSAAHGSLGLSYTFGGKPEEAIAPLLTALRLNPSDPLRPLFLSGLASAFYMQGDWEEAGEFAGRALQVKPNSWCAQATLLASLAKSGKSGEPGKQDASSYTVPIQMIEALPFADKKWNAQLLEGLRLAGCSLVK